MKKFGNFVAVVAGVKEKMVLRYRGVERGAHGLPVGEQFVEGPRLENRAGKNVRADLGTFLDNTDADLTLRSLRELHDPAGG
jgi:hypothetical protein